MTTDQINNAMENAAGFPLEFHLATGQRVFVTHPHSVFTRGRDVLILHRTAADSTQLSGYDIFDTATILKVTVADGDMSLPTADPSPLFTPGVATLAWTESLLAVLACMVICARIAKLGYDYYINTSTNMSLGDAWVIGCWSLLITVELFVFQGILRFYFHRIYPLPLHYALGYRVPRAKLLRVCAGLFWLGHAALGVWSFSQLGQLFSSVSGLWDGPVNLVIQILDGLFVFAGAHASALFLLLAAKSFGASQDGIRRLWRWRVLIDLLIVLISLSLIYQQTLSAWLNSPRRRRYGY